MPPKPSVHRSAKADGVQLLLAIRQTNDVGSAPAMLCTGND
jgi:hypothetical protein